MNSSGDLKKELKKYIKPEKAAFYPKFFRTGKGDYGEGDKFIGVTVPDQRRVALKFKDLPLKEIKKLLDSKIHEHRLTAFLILTKKYEKGDINTKEKVVNFYLENLKGVNNWDLVDSSAHKILGDWLRDKERKILYRFARSGNLWIQRISIISTFSFIRQNQLDDTFKISKILLNHHHDLIHKAVGWMLREAGKVDSKRLIEFLKDNYENIPRTALRYSIEKFSKNERSRMLRGKFNI